MISEKLKLYVEAQFKSMKKLVVEQKKTELIPLLAGLMKPVHNFFANEKQKFARRLKDQCWRTV